MKVSVQAMFAFSHDPLSPLSIRSQVRERMSCSILLQHPEQFRRSALRRAMREMED